MQGEADRLQLQGGEGIAPFLDKVGEVEEAVTKMREGHGRHEASAGPSGALPPRAKRKRPADEEAVEESEMSSSDEESGEDRKGPGGNGGGDKDEEEDEDNDKSDEEQSGRLVRVPHQPCVCY
jgi:hypothetical protein